MHTHWTRRQFLTRVGAAAAAIQTFAYIDPCCVFPADAKTSDKDLFELKQVADGIYAAIAAPTYKVNSNAAVILTNDGVVVVDSHSKPSAARALYHEIRGLTKQPVRKVINTHFHWDHWQGNEVYAAESPSLEIITSERTKENLTRPDAGVGGLSFIEKQLAAVPKEIEKLKDDIQKATSPEQTARLEANLQQTEDYLAELKTLKPVLPTRTVASSLTLDEQGRQIQLLLLGRGHTDGDVVESAPQDVLPMGTAGHERVLQPVHRRAYADVLAADGEMVRREDADKRVVIGVVQVAPVRHLDAVLPGIAREQPVQLHVGPFMRLARLIRQRQHVQATREPLAGSSPGRSERSHQRCREEQSHQDSRPPSCDPCVHVQPPDVL